MLITVAHLEWMPALLFVVYLIYGLIRPLISKRLRREIETDLMSYEPAADESVEEKVEGGADTGETRTA